MSATIERLHKGPNAPRQVRSIMTVKDRDRILDRIDLLGKMAVEAWNAGDRQAADRMYKVRLRLRRMLAGVRTGDQWVVRFNSIMQAYVDGKIDTADCVSRAAWIGFRLQPDGSFLDSRNEALRQEALKRQRYLS